jgi:hypothetical protein
VNPEPRSRLELALSLGSGYQREALAPCFGDAEPAQRVLESLEVPGGAALYPWGLDSGGLWEPWRRARESVEALPRDPQEAGAHTDYIVHDPAAGVVTLGKVGPWRSGCPRLESRSCPRLAPMGHESAHEECNYWAWPGMAAAAPGVELFPEWQRFDCSRYYPLFQWHLCGEALAGLLGVEPRWRLHAPGAEERGLLAYAALSSRPRAFSLIPFSGT